MVRGPTPPLCTPAPLYSHVLTRDWVNLFRKTWVRIPEVAQFGAMRVGSLIFLFFFLLFFNWALLVGSRADSGLRYFPVTSPLHARHVHPRCYVPPCPTLCTLQVAVLLAEKRRSPPVVVFYSLETGKAQRKLYLGSSILRQFETGTRPCRPCDARTPPAPHPRRRVQQSPVRPTREASKAAVQRRLCGCPFGPFGSRRSCARPHPQRYGLQTRIRLHCSRPPPPPSRDVLEGPFTAGGGGYPSPSSPSNV